MTERVCSVDGCGRPHKGHGLCGSHLRQAKERNSLALNSLPCEAPGCDRRAISRGLCTLHYQRMLAHGDPSHSVKPYRVTDPCSVSGCTESHFGLGMCATHYRRYRQHGDPIAGQPPLGVRCQVCDHPEVEAIDQMIADGATGPAVAARFGLGSKRAVYLHRSNHIDNDEWHAKRAAYWVNRLAEVQAAGD